MQPTGQPTNISAHLPRGGLGKGAKGPALDKTILSPHKIYILETGNRQVNKQDNRGCNRVKEKMEWWTSEVPPGLSSWAWELPPLQGGSLGLQVSSHT